MRNLLVKALAAVFAVGVMGTASAVTVNQGLTSGVLNTVEDQDREAFIDVDRDGTLSVGDVLIGFVRMDNFLPAGLSTNNQVYGILSNQITAINVGNDTTIFSLGTTTTLGLRLEDLTGNPNTAGAIVALYDRASAFATDLINAAPSFATSIFDYINFITANGTLRLTAGIVASDDYLMVDNGSGFPAGVSTSLFPSLPTSVTVNSFTGGLSVIYNNTGFTFLDAVVTFDALGLKHTNQVGIGNGATRGAAGEGRENIWGNAPGWTQCLVGGVNTPCGFVTDADYFVVPVKIPEPASLALFGVSLLGLFGVRRVSKKSRA